MKSALDIVAGKHSHRRKPVVFQSNVDSAVQAVHALHGLVKKDHMRLTAQQRHRLRRARRRLGTMLDLP